MENTTLTIVNIELSLFELSSITNGSIDLDHCPLHSRNLNNFHITF